MVTACAVYDNKIVDIYEVPDFLGSTIEHPDYEGAKIGDIYHTKEDDIDAMLVDHELRLSMVELGLDPNNESEVTK